MIIETAIRLLAVGNLLAVTSMLELLATRHVWLSMFLIILYLCVEVMFEANRKDV
jgi:hypothetical protein